MFISAEEFQSWLRIACIFQAKAGGRKQNPVKFHHLEMLSEDVLKNTNQSTKHCVFEEALYHLFPIQYNAKICMVCEHVHVNIKRERFQWHLKGLADTLLL